MLTDVGGWESDRMGEETVRINLENEGNNSRERTLYLIGKVLTNKNFNAFGLLETMKKAMNPSQFNG